VHTVTAKKPSALSLVDVDALFANDATARPKREGVAADEVDALFAGKAPKSFLLRETCDNCHLSTEPVLAFGGDDPFEMPVPIGSPLAMDLAVLRNRLQRDEILLCYPCVDALQAPPGGERKPKIVITAKRPDVGDNERPRLFAVER
jgi:hypothetical protein